MNPELQTLLDRWHDGTIDADEMRALTAALADPEARAALRRDWFLEASLPQVLAASAVIIRTPQPSMIAKLRGLAVHWLTRFAPSEEGGISALRLWARASCAALAVGLISAVWLALAPQPPTADSLDPEPSYLAQLMLEAQLPDAP